MSSREALSAENTVAESSWYALHTRHQHEKAVVRALSAMGYQVFLPLYSATHRWKDRDKQLSLPLFPSYVFLQNLSVGWRPVLNTPGVYSLVTFAGRPAVIECSEIDAIRRLVEGANRPEPHPFLKCGDRVRLTAGPLQGLEGILFRKKSIWKLVVSVELLQRSVAVEVDASMTERLRSSPCAGQVASPNNERNKMAYREAV